MTFKLATIEEKQEYYRYGEQPYRMKDTPALNSALEAAMREHGLDQQFRFIFGGVVIVREEENSETFTIARGTSDACHVLNGIVLPKYPYVRARQARGYCYLDDLGRKVSGFTNESFVPPGRIARVDYRYVDFGKLLWYLEERTTAAVLVDTKVYGKNDEVPDVEWECRMALKTRDELYYEPGLEMIDVLKQRVWENQNARLKDVAASMLERNANLREEEEAASDEAAKKEFDDLYAQISRQVEKGTVYNIPYARPQHPKLDGILRLQPNSKGDL